MTQCIPCQLDEFNTEGRHVAFGSQAKNYEHWVGWLQAEFKFRMEKQVGVE